MTRQFDVTDSRDRVYGLLGLQATDNDPKNGKLIVVPDYTISAAEIFYKLSVMMIQRSNSLRLLSSVQHPAVGYEQDGEPKEISFDTSYPSWSPQWDTVTTSTIAPWDLDDSYNAAEGFPLQINPKSAPGRLQVHGLHVAEITEVLPFMMNNLDLSPLFHPTLKDMFQKRSGLKLLSKTLTGGRSWYGALSDDAAGVLADFAAYLCEVRSETKESAGHWPDSKSQRELLRGEFIWNSLGPTLRELAVNGESIRFAEAAMAVCTSRRLFLTSNGSIGLGPSGVQKGDGLYILSGGEMPFILRPRDGHHLLVGECYVDGIMQGEAVESTFRGTTVLRGNIPTYGGRPRDNQDSVLNPWVEIW